MRITVALIILAALGCSTKPNLSVCCVTAAQCEQLNLEEMRPCGAGQTCNSGTCVAKECDTSSDCTSPGEPICLNNLCVGSCTTDDDCAGVAGSPYCATDGVCVGCTASEQCPASAAFCDSEDRSCRGCEVDSECASGVCIEADGTCAQTSTIIFVRNSGADSGDCTSASPCATLAYAYQQVLPSRNVIRVDSPMLDPAQTLPIQRSVILDGNQTSLTKPASGPLFALSSSGVVTLEGFRVFGTDMFEIPTITVGVGSTLRIVDTVLNTSLIKTTDGAVHIRDSKAIAGAFNMRTLECLSGTLTVERTEFKHTTIGAMTCQVSVTRSRFDEVGDGSIAATGGVVIIENNLITNEYEYADSMYVTGTAPGSVVRFNTFVNTSGVDSDGVALYCDSTVDVVNNIFAYRSAHPMPTSCQARFSLFDTVAVSSLTAGEGNKVADGAGFFVDVGARDSG